MKTKWPLLVALATAAAGALILGVWFAKYWPLTAWPVLSRAQILAKARDVSRQFGLDSSKSSVRLAASSIETKTFGSLRAAASSRRERANPFASD